MGKRGNNEGSITKRPDGRWEARTALGEEVERTSIPGPGRKLPKTWPQRFGIMFGTF